MNKGCPTCGSKSFGTATEGEYVRTGGTGPNLGEMWDRDGYAKTDEIWCKKCGRRWTLSEFIEKGEDEKNG